MLDNRKLTKKKKKADVVFAVIESITQSLRQTLNIAQILPNSLFLHCFKVLKGKVLGEKKVYKAGPDVVTSLIFIQFIKCLHM